jgi:general secretion pathway protein H
MQLISTAGNKTSRRQVSSLVKVRGFTLLELLVVIVLIALAATVVATGYSGASEQSRLKREARGLVSHLRYLRNQAISEGSIVSVGAGNEEGLHYLLVQPEGSRIDLEEGFILSLRAASSPVNAVNNLAQPRIVFFADGSASGGQIWVSGSTGQIAIEVSWLTGEVSINDT